MRICHMYDGIQYWLSMWFCSKTVHMYFNRRASLLLVYREFENWWAKCEREITLPKYQVDIDQLQSINVLAKNSEYSHRQAGLLELIPFEIIRVAVFPTFPCSSVPDSLLSPCLCEIYHVHFEKYLKNKSP